MYAVTRLMKAEISVTTCGPTPGQTKAVVLFQSVSGPPVPTLVAPVGLPAASHRPKYVVTHQSSVMELAVVTCGVTPWLKLITGATVPL